jgi:glycosyltransferase involved in cell wall biosynthesis
MQVSNSRKVPAVVEPSAPARKYSVLLVCRSYPPVIGGSEIEGQRVCAALRARGHAVEVVCCGGGPMPPGRRFTDPYGVPVRMYGAGSGRWNDYLYALGVARTIIGEFRNFEIVYFLMPGVHLLLGLPLARLMRKRIVMKFAGSSEIQKVTRDTVGPLEIALLRRWSEKTMVLNDGMIQEAIDAGFRRDQLLWMPNPVDTNLFAPCSPGERNSLRREFGIPPDSPTAMFVGRFAPEKELPSLLRAFALASTRFPAAKLVLAGDGPLRATLEAQARQSGVADRVIFTGMLDTPQICQWLQASDVFTLVSRVEGLPVSLIEAMAVGLPSVVSDIPATAQLITDNVHGLKAPVQDVQAIASALLALFEDPRKRKEFGAAARPVAVARFSMHKVITAYEQLFAELVAQRLR